MVSSKQRLTTKQQRDIDTFIPLMIQKLNSAGGILPLDDLYTPYGNLVVDQAVQRKLVNVIIVNRRCIKNEQPDRQIKAAHTSSWDGSKPAWLR